MTLSEHVPPTELDSLVLASSLLFLLLFAGVACDCSIAPPVTTELGCPDGFTLVEDFACLAIEELPPAPSSAKRIASVALSSDRIAVVGGTDAYEGNAAAIFDLDSLEWTAVVSGEERFEPKLVLLPTGSVLVVGGWDPLDDYRAIPPQVWSPAQGSWRGTDGDLPTALVGGVLLPLHDDTVLYAGGSTRRGGDCLKDAYLYDAQANEWKQIPQMSMARCTSGAVLLSDGRVLVCGGLSPAAILDDGYVSNACELYDPTAGDWIVTSPMTTPRAIFTLTAHPARNQVFAFGGFGGNSTEASSTSEIFDVEAARWTSAAAAPAPRAAAATAVLEGYLVVAGGRIGPYGSSPLPDSLLLYSFATETWREFGTLETPRESGVQSAVVVGEDLYFVGGYADAFPRSVVPTGATTRISLSTPELEQP